MVFDGVWKCRTVRSETINHQAKIKTQKKTISTPETNKPTNNQVEHIWNQTKTISFLNFMWCDADFVDIDTHNPHNNFSHNHLCVCVCVCWLRHAPRSLTTTMLCQIENPIHHQLLTHSSTSCFPVALKPMKQENRLLASECILPFSKQTQWTIWDKA